MSARRRSRGAMRLGVLFTPLIDIVFLLLMYFMLVAQFKTREEHLRLDLPSDGGIPAPRDPFALPADPVRISVRSLSEEPGALRVRTDDPALGSPETLEELARAVADAAARSLGVDQLVLVRPEPGTRWEHALEVVSAIMRAGLPRVHLLEAAP